MYGPASIQDVRTLLRFSVSMLAPTAILCLMWGSVLDDPTPAIVLSMVLAILVGSFLPWGLSPARTSAVRGRSWFQRVCLEQGL